MASHPYRHPGTMSRHRLAVRVAGLHRNHSRNSVFKDKLFLVVGFQDQRVLIEALDASRKFDAAHEINSEDNFVLARIVEKAVLYILRRLIHRVLPADSAEADNPVSDLA